MSAAEDLVVPTITLNSLSATLASELALGITDRDEILRRHGVTAGQWAALKASPAFRQMVRDAAREWQSDLNAKKRTQVKAAVLAEDGLGALDRILHDPDTPPAARIESHKHLTRIAGLSADTDAGASSGSGFTVSINIGNRSEPVTINAKPKAPDDAQEV